MKPIKENIKIIDLEREYFECKNSCDVCKKNCKLIKEIIKDNK
jgi:hypothetical protein